MWLATCVVSYMCGQLHVWSATCVVDCMCGQLHVVPIIQNGRFNGHTRSVPTN